MENITVLGAGVWGTALSYLLNLNGYKVTIWDAIPDVLENLKKTGTKTNLKNLQIDQNDFIFENDLLKAVSNCQYIVTVIPTQFYGQLWQKLKGHLKNDIIIINCSKGIIVSCTKFISQQFFDFFPDFPQDNFAVLSGPSYATEVCEQLPTAVVVAGSSKKTTNRIQNVFSNDWFRVYDNDDVLGVELAGAVKNVIAIAAGISNGIGFGVNASAALITRGNAEIIKLNQAIGGKPQTLYGLAGIGDLILTSTSTKSRNFTFGNLIGKGYTIKQAQNEIAMVIEGLETVKSTKKLAEKHKIEMPIINGVYDIIFNRKNPKLIVQNLMKRTLKSEF